MANGCLRGGKGYRTDPESAQRSGMNFGFMRRSVAGNGGELASATDIAAAGRTDGGEPPAYAAADLRSDRALARAIAENDDAACEELLRNCGPAVLAVARRYLGSEADAADCFQDTFIAVLNSIGSYQGRSPLRQWVRGIAINHCLMALRKRERAREESIDHMLPRFDDSGRRLQGAGGGPQPTIEESLDAHAMRQTVRAGIDKLPNDYRSVLMLRDIDGFSTREAATMLDISVTAAKTRLHRARKALKYLLQPLLDRTDSRC